MNKFIKFICDWMWQLPQNLCGVVYKSISKNNRIAEVENEDSRRVNAKVYLQRYIGGVTLGKYIFICQDYTNKEIVIKHECGHVKQSKILGPLYLIVIGLPSIIWAMTHKYIAPYNSYYDFYTEKWANKLMGIC